MIALTPDLAREVLEADRMNVVKKASGGQPLSEAERKIMQKIAEDAAPKKRDGDGAGWEKWGLKQRTFERYRAMGAPFTTPEEMVKWGEGAGIQSRFIRAFREMANQGEPEVRAAWSYDFADSEASSIEQSLDFARKRVSMYRQKFEEAALAGDQKGVDAWGAKVDVALGQLRQLEKEAPRILIESGRAVNAEELEVALREVWGSIAKGMLLLVHRVDGKLMGAPDKGARARIWTEEVGKLFSLLRMSDFTKGLAEEE